MFCKGLYTLVDEENGVAQIIEHCTSKGPAEWDAANRRRTKGVVRSIRLDTSTLVMDAEIGEKEINFGPAAADTGGQGIKALRVEGDEVRTTWYGIAGASVGIGACLPQASGVIRTEYPDDFRMGGAHRAHVDIITEKYVRVIIGVDDTDTKEKGASWVSSMKLGVQCPVGIFLEHKIIQLNPKAPNKTTNCCSTAASFAVEPKDVDKLIAYCKDFIAKDTVSDDTVMTVFSGLRIPKALADWGWSAKSVLYTKEDALKVAEENDVEVIYITGDKGAIGAVAAIGCFDLGLRSAGVPEDFE
jgi:methanogenesis imperfect marker protein 11